MLVLLKKILHAIAVFRVIIVCCVPKIKWGWKYISNCVLMYRKICVPNFKVNKKKSVPFQRRSTCKMFQLECLICMSNMDWSIATNLHIHREWTNTRMNLPYFMQTKWINYCSDTNFNLVTILHFWFWMNRFLFHKTMKKTICFKFVSKAFGNWLTRIAKKKHRKKRSILVWVRKKRLKCNTSVNFANAWQCNAKSDHRIGSKLMCTSKRNVRWWFSFFRPLSCILYSCCVHIVVIGPFLKKKYLKKTPE